MYISTIKLHNFKNFRGDTVVRFDSGVNFLVGNNNCGKSSIFLAVDFVLKKKTREEVITKDLIDNNKEFVSVEIEICGDEIQDILNSNSALSKYKKAVYKNDDDIWAMRIKRTSEDNGLGKVFVYVEEDGRYENLTGIDKTITALFDMQFVWADSNSNDVTDFSKTKVCGRIINAITNPNLNNNWNKLKEAHSEVFSDINKNLHPVETRIENLMQEQYGSNVTVNFNFNLPEISDFLKTGNLQLSEDGITTSSNEKGTGMQRALALILIQIFAESFANSEKDNKKPLFFFLDEPETFLHPQAQEKLIRSLEGIAQKSQVFIITHSPYFLKYYRSNTHSINIFSKQNRQNKVTAGIELGVLGPLSPTWGEINYCAFGLPSIEFHNELYGYLQFLITSMSGNSSCSIKEIENFLIAQGVDRNKNYIRSVRQEERNEAITLPTYIRHQIHHPENQMNTQYSIDELKKSTEILMGIIKKAASPPTR